MTEAIRWDGQLDTKPDWLRAAGNVFVTAGCGLVIRGLAKGPLGSFDQVAVDGDWIIRGAADGIYVVPGDWARAIVDEHYRTAKSWVR
jgi:hypothetical protein